MRLRAAAYAFASVLLSSLTALCAVTPDRITTPVVAAARVQTNGVHRLATAKADAGRVAADQVFHRMVLMLGRSEAQTAALAKLLADQQDPSSSTYHKWLTPTEFGERFGPSLNDVNAVMNWLKSQGFDVETPTNGRRVLLFSGTSGQVEAAFQTEMHRYSVSGKTYLANSKAASVPAALAPVVKGLAALNSFQHAKPQLYAKGKPHAISSDGYLVLSPSDVSTIYNVNPLKTAGALGDGESIAVIEESNINPLDFSDFRTLNGLPAGKLNVIVNGADPGLLVDDGEESEAILDATWAGSLAPNATINFIVSASTDFNNGIDLSTIYAVDFLVSPITSLSYGGCETLNNEFGVPSLYGALYEQGAAEGISHFVSSGDNGGDACYQQFPDAGFGVNGLGSSPYNVSVGGTDFIDPNIATYFTPPKYNATGYIPERAWNDYPEYGIPEAGTGGVSINYAKPYWQAGPGVPSDGQRDVPDVSLVAGNHEAYLTCQRDIGADCSHGFDTGFIGTSIASPVWAGIQALINQKNGVVGGAGNPNPTYYRLAAGANSPFHDITVGDDKIPDADGNLVGFAATPGYDLATGLGSVDVNALVTAWSAPTGSGTATVSLTASATHITHGGDLTEAVTVAAKTGTTVPTGDVALLAGTQGVLQLTLSGNGATSYAFGSSSPTGNELPGGTYNLTARYAGDANFAAAVSNAVPITVDAEPSTTSIASSLSSPIAYGSPLTLTAGTSGNVSNTGVFAGGTYTFSQGSTVLGTAAAPRTGESFAPSAPVQANLTLAGPTALPVGNHTITATFPGDASFLTSTSAPIAVTIVPGPTLTSLLANHTAPAVNTPVAFTANTQSFYGALVPITGTITFYDGSTPLGSVRLPTAYDVNDELVAHFSYTFTTPGLHTITAQYNGDTNDIGGVSGAVDVTVGGASSTTTTIAGPSFSLAGISTSGTTITAKVAGDSAGAVPTGMVVFTDTHVTSGTGTVLGTAMLSNGMATLSASTLASGYHNITATYSGDANYKGSVSTALIVETGDFTLTPASSSATVVQGQTTTAITLAYAAPFDYSSYASGITFTCSGLPAGAACNFSLNPLLPTISSATGAGSGTTALTISTSGPTLIKSSANHPAVFRGRGELLAMAGLLALGLPLGLRGRRRLPALLCLLLLGVAGTMSGCGSSVSSAGSGGTTYTPSGGTPTGPATVTVTATLNGGSTYGTLTHTVAVALTVTSASQ